DTHINVDVPEFLPTLPLCRFSHRIQRHRIQTDSKTPIYDGFKEIKNTHINLDVLKFRGRNLWVS
ncbi:hypothetical protein, partial [Endozoicomonas sp. ALB122]|uniref:hypothetical protein n=1 Tax=Endozoicomonas sp. ALB122 TaxID=3403075 RepID=UPI003BB6CD29